jgi:serine O-acetyltransferase
MNKSYIEDKLTQEDIVDYVDLQLKHFFPDKYNNRKIIEKNISESFDRLFFSLKFVKTPSHCKFSIYHSDLYAQFIYYLSNTIWKNDGDKKLSSKLFCLNKALHSLNCMYDTQLPDIFILIHSIGTVLGKASYSNYMAIYQRVTVGSDKGMSPVFSNGVYLGPGSSVIGDCKIGMNVHLAVNSLLLDQSINADSLVIGSSPDLKIKQLKRNIISEFLFDVK